MSSQNVPGLAVLRANGYRTPASPLIAWTGLAGLVLAPFGGYQFNLAAITAAICMSPEADSDPQRRYLAAVWAGIFYVITGLLGATVASLFTALPGELVAAIAGIALFGTIGGSLAGALAEEKEREAALVTFLVTASGLTLFGIGGAFWGLVLGLAVRRALPGRT
ncbi:benzoate/H(+) symporter BenE family transporter [Propionivibrio sp.]|uniref:benzoate/H(+) symporter BenE family transporter n=1 Tax=Propionivibrio sp. TaxID=2212460 RepID=UPI0039E523CB